MNKKRIAIFASGSGTNAQKVFEYFENHNEAEVVLLLCNKKGAGVLERAKRFGVPTFNFSREEFYNTQSVLDRLRKDKVDALVLAGFMWLIPTYLVEAFPNKIVNIHPALLPKFGGKGMYGMHVHEAVKAARESETGITIHLVNEHYDEGSILAQFSCRIEPNDSPDEIARKVQVLEHENYAKVIENLVLNKF
ncbi:formyltetrahydrofolate-dependent phosphoribosylglycinamide formyltransferase [Roseivirga ehrenbergii]|uniref:Phosphoribosylglycinamide formyltransferase n=1 Tax=Roseivirga ehrenbergii (strain DSM 102268 / JCM 13514 / KCTC 12282 / NCIMB 14502 / KMM 6017) TaxID=279360 RepID=A0A150XCB5_ROSEK|nr:phosphoribosylglycinamide formyltransferase [Roseivirga ehrenbergii]KYG76330.1 phosphoribosylglycinamide formyltransferase [Roseivirga ehrenbergii]TCL00133.1 formyltetrahydrofolate-dependent phosphoribosylglycinamide formyltransferase [Roseivirga ehrenbergii]